MLKSLNIKPSNNLFIDANHHDLIDAINQLKTAWLSFGASETFANACQAFLDELREHFSHEEVILHGAGYEHLSVHMEAHHDILKLLDAICSVGIDESTGAYFLDKVQVKLFEHELVADQGYWHLFESRDFDEGNAVVWAAQMETGNEAIDAHHKSLVRYINRMAHRMENGAPLEARVNELEQLYAYSAHHFLEEEGELIDKRGGLTSAHRKAHTKLLADLKRTINKLQNGKAPPEGLPAYLGLWLIGHITNYDVVAFQGGIDG